MNSKQVKGLAVISIADGTKQGSIESASLDFAAKRIVGFVVTPSDGAKDSTFVTVADVHALGPDALTLDDASKLSAARAEPKGSAIIDLSDLDKHKVVTQGGTFVGQVASVEFDEQSFQLTQLEASPGFFKTNKMVPAEQMMSFGGDMIVVADAVCAADDQEETATAEKTQTTSRFVVGDVEPLERSATPSTTST